MRLDTSMWIAQPCIADGAARARIRAYMTAKMAPITRAVSGVSI